MMKSRLALLSIAVFVGLATGGATSISQGSAPIHSITRTVSTDPNTFQAIPVFDLGSGYGGGTVGIQIVPTSFSGDGETFSAAGGTALFLNDRAAGFESSLMGVSGWTTGVAPLASVAGAGNASSGCQDLYGIGEQCLYVVPTGRFLRWTMQLESDFYGGIYAGAHHPVLTMTVTVQF